MSYFLGLVPTILTIGTIYALAAAGYTLIHAATRQFHLALGALYMLGAYAAFIGFTLLDILGVTGAVAILAGAMAVALVASAVGGAALKAMSLVRPVPGGNPTAPLVASIGVWIASAEAARLLHESHTLFVPPVLSGRLVARLGGHLLVVPVPVVLVFPVGIAAWALTGWAVKRSRYGRALRAVADDPGMARLLGISVARTVTLTFMLGAVLTGLAGALSVERYGAVWPYMGLLLGLKAITAAVIGGVGSLAGALVAAFGIAAAETWWTAYVAGDYRDVAVFVLLVLALIFRPDGLFARPVLDPVAGAGGARR
jgi:branched-chain amino acid transport system permease protein